MCLILNKTGKQVYYILYLQGKTWKFEYVGENLIRQFYII